MKLSVIICVYNTKLEYVDECLCSVFSSTLKDFEVIFVDDGSTVDYSALLEKYKVIYIKTENQGLLRARFTGVRVATGDYIAFVDSDDTVSLNYHFPMLSVAERENADIVFNDWAFDFGKHKNYPERDTTISRSISVSGDDALLFYTSQVGGEQSYFVQWNKIFRTELLMKSMKSLEENGVFSLKITYAEDVIINFFNFKNAKKVVNTHTGFYFYRNHPEQSVAVESLEKIKWQIDSMCYALDLMEKNIGENKHKRDIKLNINAWRELISRFHYSKALAIQSTEAGEYIKTKYGVSELLPPMPSDVRAYSRMEFIGSNFSEIDAMISDIYIVDEKKVLSYGSSCRYIQRFCDSMVDILDGRVVISKRAKLKIPKNKLTLKEKILSSPFLIIFVNIYRKLKN